MKLKDYLNAERGRQAALARAIGAHAPDLSRWADESRPVPIPYAPLIEKETGGLVSRKDLFPGEWMTIWPELANQTDAAERRSRERRAGNRRSTDKQ
jgi:DNA-binding transcriptional regulator YdaS (Cro superfamily)